MSVIPKSITAFPIVTASVFEVEGTSVKIDPRIKETLSQSPANALSVYHVHNDLLKSLQPDVSDSLRKIQSQGRDDEWIAGGNWVSELVELAGAENLFGEAGKHSPCMSWEELVRADPVHIIVRPFGFDMDKTLSELRHPTKRPGCKYLQPVKKGHVTLTDGNQYFNRPGPRLVESLEILYSGILHFGH
jgi:hypothetical protein